MQRNPELRLTPTHRQQQWMNAHEREEQNRTPDLFCWWLDLRVQGRIDGQSSGTLAEQLRTFNATQIADLPFSYR